MKKINFHSLQHIFINASHLTWALFGFTLCYFFFFIHPIFLSSETMVFPLYLPAMEFIGGDTREMLAISEIQRATGHLTPTLYPPLTNFLFTLLSSTQRTTFYKALVLCVILAYILTAYVLPTQSNNKQQKNSLTVLIFITGLFSYGLQFELERGQWNLISTSLCIIAIWLFHYKDKLQYLSYLLFSIAAQLKIYPFIFVVMFIKDWRDWKNNIKRFLVLGSINLALLLVMGPDAFVNFVKALRGEALHPRSWIGNHSIFSFVTIFASKTSNLGIEWSDKRLWFMRLVLLIIILCCIFTIIFFAYLRKHTGMNAYLLAACAISATLIPSISHDYKLSILIAPVAILCSNLPAILSNQRLHKRFLNSALSFIFFTTYFSTLFSYTNKPEILGNNFPSLFTMLIAVTCFYVFLHQSPANTSVSTLINVNNG